MPVLQVLCYSPIIEFSASLLLLINNISAVQENNHCPEREQPSEETASVYISHEPLQEQITTSHPPPLHSPSYSKQLHLNSRGSSKGVRDNKLVGWLALCIIQEGPCSWTFKMTTLAKDAEGNLITEHLKWYSVQYKIFKKHFTNLLQC